jgi:hypothetical protein
MRKWGKVAVAVVLLAAIGLTAWEGAHKKEPVYEGKPVSYWMARVGRSGWTTRTPVLGGIPRFDSKAIPTLIRYLDRHNNAVQRLYRRTWPHLPGSAICSPTGGIASQELKTCVT